MPAIGGRSRPWGAPTWGGWFSVGAGHARDRRVSRPWGARTRAVAAIDGRARGALLQGFLEIDWT